MRTVRLLIPLICLFLGLCNLYAQENTFKWDDKNFTVGTKRIMKISFWRMAPDTVMDSETYLSLDTIIDFMRRNPNLKLGIYVYLDPQGSPKHNMIYSQYRAQIALNYLISKGIDTVRMDVKGMGDANPIVTLSEINSMKTRDEKNAAYQRDRRTEVVILTTDYKSSK